MGRRSHSRTLGLWANGLRVGRWTLPAQGPMELVYDTSWLESDGARPLSLSLPLNFDGLPLKGDKVGFFFDNLLPDSLSIRQRIRARFHTKTDDAFDLLEAIGRDCVGAVQLLPDGETTENDGVIAVAPLDDGKIERLLRSGSAAPIAPRDDDDEFRISIAGAQEKTAFTLHEGRFCMPRGATPTTHIFKLPLGLVGGRQMDMTHSLENEWLCGRLLKGFGVAVADSEVRRFGTTKVLVVTRFDRTLHSSKRHWLRLPQEDFCQATGTPSARKYESDGGPGLLDLARILRGSESRREDLETLMKAEVLFWMLAAIDGHAKNFSIRILAEGRYRLTPLYDVLSAWPITGSRQNQIHAKKLKLAMALRGESKHYRVDEIERRHFNATAKASGLGSDMESILEDVVARTPAVVDRVAAELPSGFPPALFDAVTTGLKRAARRLAAMPAG